MTLAEECRRMADLLPGAPGVADLLRRAAEGLESVKVEADRQVHLAMFDAGAKSARQAILNRVAAEWALCELEGRP